MKELRVKDKKLYSTENPCHHKCRESCRGCKGCKKHRGQLHQKSPKITNVLY